MSQTEEKQEDSNVGRALDLLRGLSSYFEEDPKRVTVLLDNITEDLQEAVGYTNTEVYVGEARALARLLWLTDHKNVVKRVISDGGLADIIEALIQLTTAYDLLRSKGAETPGIKDLINQAVEALERVLRDIIGFADYCDP
jgi:hypothetical protein